ncbi:MAG: FAD-binding protein, partial [Gemmatimonadetes bacterium]|nr:FAD-binding protein [Gemmatimonadota bacterium]
MIELQSDTQPGGQPATGAVAPLDASLLSALRAAVGADGLITDPGALMVYEADGLMAYRARPSAVVMPRNTAQVAAVVRALAAARQRFVARGSGTGLSGGALPVNGAVVVSTARMTGSLALDPVNRLARVQPGLVNVRLSTAAAPHGLQYAPDPSSQTACTIGGNVAENAGGAHCLKYGVTLNHVVGLTVVLPDGEVVQLGGRGGEWPGYDLLGLFIGSEGTFGIATEVEVRLTPVPEAVETLLALFPEVDQASRAVSAIIAAGMLPAALEMVDQQAIKAVEASVYAAGLPTDIGGALVIELDGPIAGLAGEARQAEEICRGAGATQVQRAANEAERQRLWYARKKAFGAMGRLAPDVLVQDACVPRSKLPQALRACYDIAARWELMICNIFHAGDGNLHPTILFDRRDPEQVHRVEHASMEMMKACVDLGGTMTGEHGVGYDKKNKLPLVCGPEELALMGHVRDVFDPAGIANPDKILPREGYRPWTGAETWIPQACPAASVSWGTGPGWGRA